jgi:hypothetical protein
MTVSVLWSQFEPAAADLAFTIVSCAAADGVAVLRGSAIRAAAAVGAAGEAHELGWCHMREAFGGPGREAAGPPALPDAHSPEPV